MIDQSMEARVTHLESEILSSLRSLDVTLGSLRGDVQMNTAGLHEVTAEVRANGKAIAENRVAIETNRVSIEASRDATHLPRRLGSRFERRQGAGLTLRRRVE